MSYINLIGNLGQYTDEMSFEAISNAVLQTQLMEYATLRSGLRAGTTAVNILDVDIAAQARNCSWSDNATVDFTQVDIVMNELESKVDVLVLLVGGGLPSRWLPALHYFELHFHCSWQS